MIKKLVGILLLIILVLQLFNRGGEKPIDSLLWEADSERLWVVLFSDRLVIYSFHEDKNRFVKDYVSDLTGLNPWTLAVGHLDDDGDLDIFVGVYKATPFFKEVGKRPFIFSYNGAFIYKKWTGSALSYSDFEQVRFEDRTGNGLHELVVMEGPIDGPYHEGVYVFANRTLYRLSQN
jgi:hypothetical protein